MASSIGDQMNMDNTTVKVAPAETHIIQEIKTYLENQGVLLSSFSSRALSDTTIPFKNIWNNH